MPEGDTIHHAAARIRAVLEGRVPDEIVTPHPRHQLDRWPERLAGRSVRAVEARGKHLFLRFDGGLTLHSHVSARAGWSARPRTVYNRAGLPCPRCGTPIRGRGQGEDNRTTYWCPGCQR
jgi:endonuclease-8